MFEKQKCYKKKTKCWEQNEMLEKQKCLKKPLIFGEIEML